MLARCCAEGSVGLVVKVKRALVDEGYAALE
jgi:hypothetical protein